MSVENHQRACPGCGSVEQKSAGFKNGFDIFVCQNCDTIYTSHLPPETEAENYDEYYTESNLTAPEFINKRLEEIIGEFSEFRQTNRILDIGFGAAPLMQTARRLGWQPFGIEVSKPAIDQARQFGFEVFHGELTDAHFPDDHFDVVTASEILEHLPDPQAALNEIARILRPGGLLWATTPSARGLSFRLSGIKWSIISPPEHTQLFSQKAIRQMLYNAGFSDVLIKTHGFNPLEAIHNFRSKFHENPQSAEQFNRVGTGYQLNESLTSSPTRKLVKNLLNGTLNLFRTGDSLKIFAKL